jgi:Mn-containing catalase
VNAEKSGDARALREGSIGRVFGMDHYMSQAVAKHATGVTAAQGVKLAAATAEGDDTLSLKGTALTGRLVKGDVLTDLNEDLAAEQKARTTYDNILRLADDPDVREPIKFLRQRELVHYQRFGDALRIARDKLDSKNFYAYNPAFDKVNGVFRKPK